MGNTVVKGMQSEIFVPVTPPPVWTPVTKPLKDMVIAIATAAGVHHKDDKRFNLAGDFTFRVIKDTMPSSELMVSHGGYDNGDVNKDINCMFPIDLPQWFPSAAENVRKTRSRYRSFRNSKSHSLRKEKYCCLTFLLNY